MNPLDILLHLLNFAAPALALAVLLPWLSRLVVHRRDPLVGWGGQMLLNFAVGLAALVAAAGWLGRDGKMMGYALLVLSVATSQWLLLRGWRR